jgi:hypothetical protein
MLLKLETSVAFKRSPTLLIQWQFVLKLFRVLQEKLNQTYRLLHSDVVMSGRWIATFRSNMLPQLGLTDDPTCERCLEEDESATHILCDCEAIAYLRFRHLGQYFLEPSDYYDAPIDRVLHFIRSVGLIKGQSKGKHNRSVMVTVQGPNYYGPPLHIHSTCCPIFA